ncbi:hypothetical protein Cfor_07546, partial [Coptotermes formosanus]
NCDRHVPGTLFNMSVEELGVYVSEFMRHLVTDRRYTRGPDGKYHHYQVPCSRLQAYTTCYVPRDCARDVTMRLIRKVSQCYSDLVNDGRFKSACEEIAPHVLKAVIHPSVKCLDFVINEEHPTPLDYYKAVSGDLVYRTLPLLNNLKVLRIGKMATFADVPLDVEGFKDTLEAFSTHNYLEKDIETLSDKCKHIRYLDLAGTVPFPSNIFNLISRFEYLEEVNLSQLRSLSSDDLKVILYWLNGLIPLYRLFTQNNGDISRQPLDPPEGSEDKLLEVYGRKHAPRDSGQLKSFGCANVTEEYVDLICMFYNLTSLILCDVRSPCSLLPLTQLKLLQDFTLIRSHFSDAEEFLIAVGGHLICLNLVDVFGTSFTFISQNCRSLKCLHLSFSRSDHLILPTNYRDVDSYSLPLPDFPLVVNLQVYIKQRAALLYILSRFPNLRKLAVTFTAKDFVILEYLMRRSRLTHLEELYWGLDTVINFSERPPLYRSLGCVHE